MPMGAAPARAFGGRASAGRRADLNSSQGDDHSTSRRGGSGHCSGMGATSGVVMTTDIISGCVGLRGLGISDSVPENGVDFAVTSVFFILFQGRWSECFEA